MKWSLFACALAAGCSSGGGNGPQPDLAPPLLAGWSLQGTLAGFSLQDEAVAGEAHKVTGAAVPSVLVQLSSRAKICELLQQNACPNGRILGFRAGGLGTGSFAVVDQAQPAAGQAHIFFLDLDAQCGENVMVSATSGTLTVTAADLSPDGLYQFSFDATTPEGPISGQVRAPFCQI
jgi:hypothetical protein